MNDVNPPSDAAEEMASLQNQLTVLKLALVVVAGTLVAYLYYQSHIVGKDVAANRPIAMPVIQAFQQNYVAAENFKGVLAGYAITHPDFQPILKKYGWTPSSTPTPAPAPVKK